MPRRIDNLFIHYLRMGSDAIQRGLSNERHFTWSVVGLAAIATAAIWVA